MEEEKEAIAVEIVIKIKK